MSRTLLEIAVALLLLWVAWRIGVLLTPWIIARWRASKQEPASTPKAAPRNGKPPQLTNNKD